MKRLHEAYLKYFQSNAFEDSTHPIYIHVLKNYFDGDEDEFGENEALKALEQLFIYHNNEKNNVTKFPLNLYTDIKLKNGGVLAIYEAYAEIKTKNRNTTEVIIQPKLLEMVTSKVAKRLYKVFFMPDIEDREMEILSKIILTHGGSVVPNSRIATHIVYSSQRLYQPYRMAYQGIKQIDEEVMQMHQYGTPESQDLLIPKNVLKDLRNSRRVYLPHPMHVEKKWVYDVDTHNEWMKEHDYIPTQYRYLNSEITLEFDEDIQNKLRQMYERTVSVEEEPDSNSVFTAVLEAEAHHIIESSESNGLVEICQNQKELFEDQLNHEGRDKLPASFSKLPLANNVQELLRRKKMGTLTELQKLAGYPCFNGENLLLISHIGSGKMTLLALRIVQQLGLHSERPFRGMVLMRTNTEFYSLYNILCFFAGKDPVKILPLSSPGCEEPFLVFCTIDNFLDLGTITELADGKRPLGHANFIENLSLLIVYDGSNIFINPSCLKIMFNMFPASTQKIFACSHVSTKENSDRSYLVEGLLIIDLTNNNWNYGLKFAVEEPSFKSILKLNVSPVIVHSFEEMKLSSDVVRRLDRKDIVVPTHFQKKLVVAVDYSNYILASVQQNTKGVILAYTLIASKLINAKTNQPRCFIVVESFARVKNLAIIKMCSDLVGFDSLHQTGGFYGNILWSTLDDLYDYATTEGFGKGPKVFILDRLNHLSDLRNTKILRKIFSKASNFKVICVTLGLSCVDLNWFRQFFINPLIVFPNYEHQPSIRN